MAELSDIEWYRGDSYPKKITLKDGDGVVIDITGYSFVLTVNSEKNPDDDTTKIFEVAGTLPAPTTGVVYFTPTAVNTDQDIATYYYDIQMTDASANVRTIAKHKFKITQDISK